MKTIRPLGKRLLVKRTESTTTTAGGLHIPSSAQSKANQGEVIAVSKGWFTENGAFVEPSLCVGDTVMFGKFSGSDITLDGKDFVIMSEEEVIGVLDS